MAENTGIKVGAGVVATLAVIIVALVVTVLALIVNGTAGASTSTSAAVPAVCITALDDAEAIVQSSSSAMSITSDLVTATANGDTASINDLNNQISSLIPGVKILVAAYTTDSATCRALK